ncbi:MAG: ATP-dependent DNA helicase [Vicinamibacteria bacterium]
MKLEANFFGPGGRLARVFPSYEERISQQQLCLAIAETITNGGVLLAEAGTGTGKTVAYLVPAITAGKRIVISTGTKNLQDQLVEKDIPLVAEALGRDVKVALMKGRGNYLCRLRFNSFQTSGQFQKMDEIPLFRSVEEWAKETQTGDRAEIDGLPDSVNFWREIAATSENCIGQKCAEYSRCYVTEMRKRGAEAELVVVNHHLLVADLAVRENDFGEVIPPYDVLILDEAHTLEAAATQHFGAQVSWNRTEELCRDIERELAAARINAPEVLAEVANLRNRAERFFKVLTKEAGRRLRAKWVTKAIEDDALAFALRLEGVKTSMASLVDRPEPVRSLEGRAMELRDHLLFILKAEDHTHVYFAEARGRNVVLRATPIDVSRILKEKLFDQLFAAVLTSATLTVDKNFSYIRSRLGIEGDHTADLALESPFDFASQAVLYLPPGVPDPRETGFIERAVDEIAQIVEITHGRAFVLFTSYANLHSAAERLAARIPYPILVQGEESRARLLQLFKKKKNPVLLGTSSFWQGVDVAGDQLSAVIIDKLPFASPAEPVVAARIEKINAQKGNAFSDYQVPEAILMLKQGLGRLIRTATDRGVLAILDSRLTTKGYGKRFLASLPPARQVKSIQEVQDFFHPGS